MAYTLSNLLQDAYMELGQLSVSTATTAGTTVTVVDSKQVGEHGDDAWKNGVVFIVRAGGAAPEGEFQRCSAYTDSTGTFTVDTAFTTAPVSGITYAWASDYYPFRTMIELANGALRNLGDIVLVDKATLTTASNQTEYTSSVGWNRRRPIRIQIQGRTGDSNDNQWYDTLDWDFVPAAAGTTGLIIFPMQPTTSRTVAVWYHGVHPTLSAYTSTVSETIPPVLAKWALVARAAKWQLARAGGEEAGLIQLYNDARSEYERANAEAPIWRPHAKSKLFIVRGAVEENLTAPDPAART